MFGIFKDAFNQFQALVIPDKSFAWQTLLLLSLFSWLLAVIAEALGASIITVNVISTGSWLFLFIAVWWALTETPVTLVGTTLNISPWITGIIFCVLLFNPWTEERFRLALASWPVVSTLIAGGPQFVESQWKSFKLPKKELRQPLAMMLLVNLLLTSWILFFLRIQTWLDEYPSLLVDDFSRSSFVVHIKTEESNFSSQGALLLDQAASALERELDGIPWPQTERWLLNIDEGILTLADNVDLAAEAEIDFWSLNLPIPRRDANGYELRLQANWLGPTSQRNGYFLEKVCRVLPRRQEPAGGAGAASATAQDSTDLSRVDCAGNTPTMIWVESPVES